MAMRMRGYTVTSVSSSGEPHVHHCGASAEEETLTRELYASGHHSIESTAYLRWEVRLWGLTMVVGMRLHVDRGVQSGPWPPGWRFHRRR